MEHTWTKDFYQETDPEKRQQILKEYIGEEEAWEEEYRARLWTARYGQRRLQKDEFVKCLMELKYLAEGTSLDPGGDRRKMGARILSTLCLAEAMQSDEGYQKILADELYNVFLKFIQVSRGGRGFTSLVFGMMGDVVEYGQWKSHLRQESLIFAGGSIGTKVGAGLASAVITGLLSSSGYVSSSAGMTAQPETALEMIVSLYKFGPILIAAVIIVTLFGYKLDKMYPAIMQELTEREAHGQL